MLTILGKDDALGHLADFFGYSVEHVDIHGLLSSNTRKVLAASASSIEEVKLAGHGRALQAYIETQTSHTLIYGMTGLSVGDRKQPYSVTDQAPKITRQFSGLTFGYAGENDSTFPDPGALPLINIGEGVYFAKRAEGQSEVFLLGSSIPDIDRIISTNLDVPQRFSGMIPAAMFLKYAFKWQSRVRPMACWIIDDPNLRENRYGFINYSRLLSIAQEHNAFFEIAFIPFNFDTTRQEIADLFIRNSDRLAICVHGCDHSRDECGWADYETAERILTLATARMERHSETTCLAYNRVMAFPRGKFSTVTMTALKNLGYLGAINSGCLPNDRKEGFTLRTLMQPILREYSGLPLMVRRYANQNVADFALDLFLERPALIVEHQNYFRDSDQVIGFIKKINALDEQIYWTDLTSILKAYGVEQKEGRSYKDYRLKCGNPCTRAIRWLYEVKNTGRIKQ